MMDTSKVEEMEREKAKPAVIRQDMEKEMRERGEDKSWRVVAVTKDPRQAGGGKD